MQYVHWSPSATLKFQVSAECSQVIDVHRSLEEDCSVLRCSELPLYLRRDLIIQNEGGLLRIPG